MSLSKLVLVLTLLIFALPANGADGSKGSAAKSSASGDKGGSDGGEKKSGKSNKKMALEGGLYTTDKVKVIKSNKNRPVSNQFTIVVFLTFFIFEFSL